MKSTLARCVCEVKNKQGLSPCHIFYPQKRISVTLRTVGCRPPGAPEHRPPNPGGVICKGNAISRNIADHSGIIGVSRYHGCKRSRDTLILLNAICDKSQPEMSTRTDGTPKSSNSASSPLPPPLPTTPHIPAAESATKLFLSTIYKRLLTDLCWVTPQAGRPWGPGRCHGEVRGNTPLRHVD